MDWLAVLIALWVLCMLMMVPMAIFARRAGWMGFMGHTHHAHGWDHETPREILDRRYANGELTNETYRSMLDDLDRTQPSA